MDILLSLLQQQPRSDWEWKLDVQTGWSRNNALSLANCALLAYNDLSVVEAHLLPRGFATVVPLQPSILGVDTQGYVAVRDDAVVVAFRGTEPTNPLDYFTDFNSDCVAFEEIFNFSGWGNIWAGWADGVQAVLPQLLGTLTQYTDDKRTLWITGHSLGGALATVMAAIVTNMREHSIQGVYTFGQPRVGDPTFCKHFTQKLGDRTFRHVNDNDLVPHVPPRRLTRLEQQMLSLNKPLRRVLDFADTLRHREEVYEYDHVGQLRLLLPEGGWTSNLAEETNREPVFFKEDRTNAMAALNLARLTLEAVVRIKDHAPINGVTHDGYIDRLERL